MNTYSSLQLVLGFPDTSLRFSNISTDFFSAWHPNQSQGYWGTCSLWVNQQVLQSLKTQGCAFLPPQPNYKSKILGHIICS